MHGFAKRGLALAAAASGLVLGTAGIAAADATATGETAHSGGVNSGNVVNSPLAAPVNFCGNQALVTALKNVDEGSICTIGPGEGALAQGSSEYSGGVGSGNVANTAVSMPLNVCGNQSGTIVVKDKDKSQTCTIGTNSDEPGAIATGASDHSGGLLSGNVANTAVSMPLNVCGNQSDVIGFRNTVDGTTCTIG